MGRPVSFDFTTGGGSPEEFLMGVVYLEPTLMHTIGSTVVLPDAPYPVKLVNGKAVHPNVAVSPAGPEPAWAYKVIIENELTGKAWSEFRGVPTGTTQIAYKDLTKFVTTIPPETTAGMMQNWADTTEANAERSEIAADRAEAPTDLMNKNLIEDTASLTNAALSDIIGESALPGGSVRTTMDNVRVAAATGTGVYIPSGAAGARWRATRQKVLSGQKQGHIAVMGDSIPFGAATTGTTAPKALSSYPGRLRSMLDIECGASGSGIVLANNSVLTNQAWDPRWTFTSGVINHPFGLHMSSAYRANTGTADFITFTDTCTEFWVYTLAGGGTFTAQVDGGAVQTMKNTTTEMPSVVQPEPGYFSSSPAHNVFKIDAGGLGEHTIKLSPGSGNLFLTSIEARIATPGTFRVSNVSISGKSLASLYSGWTGEDIGTQGLAFVDSFRADLLVIALGINDAQATVKQTPAQIKTWLETLVARQRSTGVTSAGSTLPDGEAVLVWNPKPKIESLNMDEQRWADVRAVFYEVALEQDVVLIDLAEIWTDYATANAAGLYADTIHPNNKGSYDMAKRMHAALFHEVY